MICDISMTEARQQLNTLPERLVKESTVVAVTRRGKRVLALVSWEHYEALVETLEIMADEALMNALRQGIREAEQGKALPWREAREELGL